MFAKISPWALVGLLLAAAGVAVASLAGIRWLSVTLPALGLMTALAGMAAGRKKHTSDDWTWLGLAAAMSGSIAGIGLLAPGWLNPRWNTDLPMPEADPNQLVRVLAEHPWDDGTPLAEGTTVDAATEGIRRGDLTVVIKSAKAAELPGTAGRDRLQIQLWVRQVGQDREIVFAGLSKERHTPVLTDAAGRRYAFLGHYPQRFSKTFDLRPLRMDHVVVFELPSGGAESLNLELPGSAWGQSGTYCFNIKAVEREPPPDLRKQVAQYKKLLRRPPQTPPDITLGRAVFAKHCRECHTLFGDGGKAGPDLTAAKREDLDFLVTSVVNPSAELAKGFEPQLIITTTGQLINGIIKEKTDRTITVQTSGPKVTVPVAEIEEIQPSKISLMPIELLKPFDEHEVRSLFKYLGSKRQVPMLARQETAAFFSSHGENLAFWQPVRGAWSVDRGEIIAVTRQAGVAPVLLSDLEMTGAFGVAFRVHLAKEGRAAVRLGGAERDGPRVELAAGKPIVLVDGAGKQGESQGAEAGALASDGWQRVEIHVAGPRMEVRLGGKLAGVLKQAALPGRRAVVLEGSTTVGQEARFANLDLELTTGPKE